MPRRFALSSIWLLLLSSQVLAQRQIPQQRITTELTVRVTYEDDRSVGDNVRVQLTNPTGIPIQEAFTRGEGQARFLGIEPGAYKLRVIGMDIEETTSEYSFVIQPRQFTHMEFVRVRRKVDPNAQQTSTQGSISAAALNIPREAESEFDKGVKAMVKKKDDEARKRFARATEIYPRYASAFNNMGVIAMQQGRKDEAIGFFRQAVNADDQHAPSYLNLAKAVVAQQNLAEAQILLTKAASIDPNNVEIVAILAMIEFEAGQSPMALTNARKVHGLPNHEKYAFAHYIAGKVLEAQNQPQEALVEYRLFLKEAPHSNTAASVRQVVAALEQQKK